MWSALFNLRKDVGWRIRMTFSIMYERGLLLLHILHSFGYVVWTQVDVRQ